MAEKKGAEGKKKTVRPEQKVERGLAKKQGKGKKSEKTPKKEPKHVGRLVWSVTLMLVWVGASVIVSQLVVGYVMIWMIGAEGLSKPVPTAIYSALSYVIAMLLVILVPMVVTRKRKGGTKLKLSKEEKKEQLKTLGLSGWPTWTDVGLAPVGFVAYVLLAGAVVGLFSLFPWFDTNEVQEVGFSYYVSGVDRLVAFLTLVVVAPVAEEIIFRGWLYGKMREKIAEKYSNKVSIVVSIFLVSLLFGLVHMQWNVGVNVFALSIVLCGMREITGTIYAGILLHMLKNGVAFVILYMLGMG